MATHISALAETILEGLEPMVEDYMRQQSTMMAQIHPNSAGKWKKNAIGRGWQIEKTWRLGVSGAVQFGSPNGPDMANVPTAPGYRQWSGVETYPGLNEASVKNTFSRTLTLKKVKGNMFLPATWIRANELQKSFGSETESEVQGSAENVSRLVVNSFFAQKDNSGAGKGGMVGQFTAAVADGLTVDNSGLSVDLLSGSSISRFVDGQAYDLFADNSATRVNSEGPVFVSIVDGVGTEASPITSGGTVSLFMTGSNSCTLVDGTTYSLVPRNSGRESDNLLMQTALDDVMVDTGNIADWGLSVDSYPMLKTVRRSLSGKPLTPGYLLALISHIEDVFGPGKCPDSIWARRQIWAAYFHQKAGQFVIERNGALLDVKDGVASGAKYQLEGTSVSFNSDAFLPEKVAYGLRMGGNNWAKITPPRLPGSGSHGAFLGGVEFLGPWYGYDDVFIPYHQVGGAEAGATTDFKQAPFEYYFEIAPEQFGGTFRISNVGTYLAS